MTNHLNDLLETLTTDLENDPKTYSPLALAYIGDGVYEMFIRTAVLKKGNAPVNKLHKSAKEWVRAGTQAKIYHLIEPQLSEKEKNILRRGRNAKSISAPKNADITEYRHATGLEALIGYLYIEGNIERIKELIYLGLTQIQTNTNGQA